MERPPIESEEIKKSPEEIILDEKRGNYANAYTEYRKAFGEEKEKDLAGFEAAIEPARKFIKVGDSEKLKEEKKEGYTKLVDAEALNRKQNFIAELINRGIKKEQAEAIYDAELTKIEYENSKLELGKKMKEGGKADEEIFKKLILDEKEALNKAKVESWPPKEKGIFRKGMEWYMRRGTVTRLLISTGLVTGVVAGVGGFGASAAAMFAGYRFVRGAGAVLSAKLAGKGVDWAMSKGIEAQKEASLEKLKTGFDLNNLKETEKELEKIFEETAKKERRKLLIKAAASVMAGAGTAMGMGMLEHAWAGGVKVAPPETPKAPVQEVMPPPVAAEIKPEVLPISSRGPEGSIIDYFKGNPEAAEKFGWDGQTDLDKWAGIRAHQLWLEDAEEALAKPETLAQLEELGYSADAEGYAEMMHRIGKGAVEIDPQTGEINLVEETEYLEAPVAPEVPPEAPEVTPKAEAKNLFDSFDKQTRPEKWGTIQSYQHDIDSMKDNLAKFTDPQVKASVQAEIVRLENIKQSLIHRLAEQTEQVEPVASAVKATETIAHILPEEKQSFLDNLIYGDKGDLKFSTLPQLAKQIVTGKLTVEDFYTYYTDKLGIEGSDRGLTGLKNTFRDYIEGNAKQRLNAESAIGNFIIKLEKIK